MLKCLRNAPLLFLLVSIISFAADRDGEVQEQLELEAMKDCGANQSNMNLCSYHMYKKLDDELNLLYKSQRERLKGTKHEKRFVEAQRAWLKYVDADCLYQNGQRSESGTIWPLMQNICLSGHTGTRIELLKSYLSCTQNGCPGQ